MILVIAVWIYCRGKSYCTVGSSFKVKCLFGKTSKSVYVFCCLAPANVTSVSGVCKMCLHPLQIFPACNEQISPWEISYYNYID